MQQAMDRVERGNRSSRWIIWFRASYRIVVQTATSNGILINCKPRVYMLFPYSALCNSSKLRLGRTIIPLPLVVLLLDAQVREYPGHDPARTRARHDGVLGKVGHALVAAEKVLVQLEAAVDIGGRGAEDGEDGVGEDGRLAEVGERRGVGEGVGLGCCRFDCLPV
jgi:hypothetical protein